jgi:hypothetical protein
MHARWCTPCHACMHADRGNRRLGSSRTADTSGAGASAATFFASSAAVTSRRCVILRVSAARECGGISSNPKLCQALQRTVAPLAVEHTCAHTSPRVSANDKVNIASHRTASRHAMKVCAARVCARAVCSRSEELRVENEFASLLFASRVVPIRTCARSQPSCLGRGQPRRPKAHASAGLQAGRRAVLGGAHSNGARLCAHMQLNALCRSTSSSLTPASFSPSCVCACVRAGAALHEPHDAGSAAQRQRIA